MPTYFWLQHLPTLIFVFCFGACVGSFLNVVIYRLPAGMSVSKPHSRCPICGWSLRFGTENLPILGWVFLRGRCRKCQSRISPQYMLIELLLALLCAGLYVLLYMVPATTPVWGEIGNLWWDRNEIWRTWPAFFLLFFLIAGLIAMTVIDARTFTIPIQIPLFITIAAFIAWPLQALLPLNQRSPIDWPIPGIGWRGTMVAVFGCLGLLVPIMASRWRWFRRAFTLGQAEMIRREMPPEGKQRNGDAPFFRLSFLDYDKYVTEDHPLADYPHARREMWVEIKWVLPCLVGLATGWLIGGALTSDGPPIMVQAIGASLLGYLVGGGLVWGIRILGSLAFGREAMGMGDVHLLGAVGAVLGWFDATLTFFLAPFAAIGWLIISNGLATVMKTGRREIPFGPYLAMGALAIVFARPAITRGWEILFAGNVPLPQPGLVP